MFGKYFTLKYFSYKYFAKSSTVEPLYQNSGDIRTKLIQDYSASGDLSTIVGLEFSKNGDLRTLLLKRSPHLNIEFGYDIKTELT